MKSTKLLNTVPLLIVGLGLAVNGYSQSFLTNGLVAYYPLNGNANDSSGNGNNGTAVNVTPVPDRLGQPNMALGFDGVDSHIEAPKSLPNMSSASFCVWLYNYYFPTSDYQMVFFDGDSTPDRDFLLEMQVNVGLMFRCKDNAVVFIPMSMLRTQSWMSVIGVADAAAGKMSLWLDGVLVTTTNSFTGNANQGYHYKFDIGYAWDGHYGPGRYFAGRIDELRIYNRALSPDEVEELYAIESGPRVDLIKAVKPSFSYLTLTTNYQMQISGDMSKWTNYGAAFKATSTSMEYPQYFDVDNWNSLFFRVKSVP